MKNRSRLFDQSCSERKFLKIRFLPFISDTTSPVPFVPDEFNDEFEDTISINFNESLSSSIDYFRDVKEIEKIKREVPVSEYIEIETTNSSFEGSPDKPAVQDQIIKCGKCAEKNFQTFFYAKDDTAIEKHETIHNRQNLLRKYNYRCPYCKLYFSTKNQLEGHKIYSHFEENNKMNELEMKKYFKDYKEFMDKTFNLEEIIEKYGNLVNFDGEEFINSAYIFNDYECLHDDSVNGKKKMHQCYICGICKKVHSKYFIIDHFAGKHLNLKRHQCSCGYRTGFGSALANHIKKENESCKSIIHKGIFVVKDKIPGNTKLPESENEMWVYPFDYEESEDEYATELFSYVDFEAQIQDSISNIPVKALATKRFKNLPKIIRPKSKKSKANENIQKILGHLRDNKNIYEKRCDKSENKYSKILFHPKNNLNKNEITSPQRATLWYGHSKTPLITEFKRSKPKSQKSIKTKISKSSDHDDDEEYKPATQRTKSTAISKANCTDFIQQNMIKGTMGHGKFKVYKCKLCNRDDIFRADTHARLHLRQKQFNQENAENRKIRPLCNVCNLRFASKQSVQKHMLTEHNYDREEISPLTPCKFINRKQ